MSIVKVDLRVASSPVIPSSIVSSSTSQKVPITQYQIQQLQTSSSSSSNNGVNASVAAPLVKISLTPEGNRLSDHSFSSQTSPNVFPNSAPEATISPLQSAQIPLRSCNPTSTMSANNAIVSSGSPQPNSNGSLSNRFSPLFSGAHSQQVVNSMSSSPSGTPLLRSLCNGTATMTTTTTSTIHTNMPTSQVSPQKQISPSSRFDVSKNRKVSSPNSTEESLESRFPSSITSSHPQTQAPPPPLFASHPNQQLHLQTLNRRLEQSQLENSDLRQKLSDQKQQSQSIISENLQMKEELIKAQKRLKQYEQLHSMRVPNQSSHQQHQLHNQRPSLFVSRQPKTYYSNQVMPATTREIEGNQNRNDKQNQSVSGDFSSCDQQHVIESTTHFNNRLSNHSILDILSDLKPENNTNANTNSNNNNNNNINSSNKDSIAGNRSFFANENQRRAQVKQANKSICTAQQAKRRSEVTPKSFTRLDTNVTSSQKKTFH